MKKIFGAAAAAAAAAAILLSGCSDFSFNPTGVWRFEADVVYQDDKEVARSGTEDMPFETLYIFEKCGTGHITVDGDVMRNYTYEYDDNSVILHVADSHDESVIYDMTFDLAEDGKTLVRKIESYFTDDDGDIVSSKEEFIFTRQ